MGISHRPPSQTQRKSPVLGIWGAGRWQAAVCRAGPTHLLAAQLRSARGLQGRGLPAGRAEQGSETRWAWWAEAGRRPLCSPGPPHGHSHCPTQMPAPLVAPTPICARPGVSGGPRGPAPSTEQEALTAHALPFQTAPPPTPVPREEPTLRAAVRPGCPTAGQLAGQNGQKGHRPLPSWPCCHCHPRTPLPQPCGLRNSPVVSAGRHGPASGCGEGLRPMGAVRGPWLAGSRQGGGALEAKLLWESGVCHL